jgi:hypothetical protein
MASNETSRCAVCGKPSHFFLTEIHNGDKTNRSLCFEHAPPELRDQMQFGPHRTPVEEREAFAFSGCLVG